MDDKFSANTSSSSNILRILSLTTLIIISSSSSSTMAIIIDENSPQAFVDAHNRARAQVGVQPLSWNDTVAKYASDYARRRSKDCKLEHSMGPYGENLAEGWGSSTSFSGVDAVEMWAGEKSCYHYDSNSCVGGECLHYTQLVWKDTIHLGCARLPCQNNNWMFVICSYDPPGNYIGQRPY